MGKETMADNRILWFKTGLIAASVSGVLGAWGMLLAEQTADSGNTANTAPPQTTGAVSLREVSSAQLPDNQTPIVRTYETVPVAYTSSSR